MKRKQEAIETVHDPVGKLLKDLEGIIKDEAVQVFLRSQNVNRFDARGTLTMLANITCAKFFGHIREDGTWI